MSAAEKLPGLLVQRVIEQYALDLYHATKFDRYCIHPLLLVDCHGFKPPYKEIEEDYSLYRLRQYRWFAKRILKRDRPTLATAACIALLTDQLILPRVVATRVPAAELPLAQPYVPAAEVLRIYKSYFGRGRYLAVAS